MVSSENKGNTERDSLLGLYICILQTRSTSSSA